MKILIFIPCYNCHREIEILIEKLSKTNLMKHDFSFLFIDNDSQDKTVDSILLAIKKYNLKNFKIIRNLENYGVGGSHKIAFYYAIKNLFLIILNFV